MLRDEGGVTVDTDTGTYAQEFCVNYESNIPAKEIVNNG